MTKLILLIFICTASFAQSNEQNAVRSTIDNFFGGMKNHDSTAIRKTLHGSCFLKSVVKTKAGEVKLIEEKMDNFIKSVVSLNDKQLDERLLSYDIKIDGAMAIAWTPYEFYLDGQFSHCGVNTFTLIKTETAWQILGIIDTRRKEGCK